MNRIWAIPVLVSILILGSLGFSQDAMADHNGLHATLCNDPVTVGGGALGNSAGGADPVGPPNSLGWSVGSGQCNGSFSSVTDLGFDGGSIELALRAEERRVGQVTPSGINDYTVQLGNDANAPPALNRAWWNFQGSVAYNGVINNLDSLTLTIRTDVGPNFSSLPVFDLLNVAPVDARNNQPNPTSGFADLYQFSQNPEFCWFTVAPDTDGNPGICPGTAFDYSVPGAWLFTLTAVEGQSTSSVSICIHTPGEVCENKFEKVIDTCVSDVFTKKHNGPQSCIFTINHDIGDSTLSIHDTVPAEWEVLSAKTQLGNDCVVESAGKGKGSAGKSATNIWCPDDEGPITVEIETRKSPGKGHKNEVFKPTFCGVLSLNDGAVLLDDAIPPNVLATTNSLSVLVSEDGDSSQDCDGDGLTDLQEYTGSENNDFGNEPTDPANPDSDGDGLSDFDEINIYTSDPNTTTTTILDTALLGSPGGSINPFADDHLSTGTSFGDGGGCAAYSGSVFVLDNGYINVSATGLLRSTDCIVPTTTHDNVQATLHCDEGDAGTTSTVPLSTNGGATTEGDFDLEDSLGAIGTCTSATVFVESDGNGKWLAKSP